MPQKDQGSASVRVAIWSCVLCFTPFAGDSALADEARRIAIASQSICELILFLCFLYARRGQAVCSGHQSQSHHYHLVCRSMEGPEGQVLIGVAMLRCSREKCRFVVIFPAHLHIQECQLFNLSSSTMNLMDGSMPLTV